VKEMKENKIDSYDFLDDLEIEELLEFIDNLLKNPTYVIKGDLKEIKND
jgi:hypothetical protein